MAPVETRALPRLFTPPIFDCVGRKCHTFGNGKGRFRGYRASQNPSFDSFSIFVARSFRQCASSWRTPQRVDGTVATPEADEGRDRIARDMAKKANLDRQAALKNDTDKLVKLAGELKDYVDKSNENVLSLEVLKKAEEIEKLAHNVKEKMKGPN